MKLFVTLTFILSSLVCSGQEGYIDNAGTSFKTTPLTSLTNPATIYTLMSSGSPWPTTEITTQIMVKINPSFISGQADYWIDMPIDELIHIIFWEYRIDLYKIKADLSKTKIKNFYYLMVGDDAAHIGRDKKLIVNDTLKAQKILTQAILNYHR